MNIIDTTNSMFRAPIAIVEQGEFSEEFRKVMTSASTLTHNPLSGKLADLKAIIGDELYSALNDEDRLLMAETAGTIDFGHPIDLDFVARNISEYGYTE